MMDDQRILITGGGTGGHLIPGIALYEEFRSRNVLVSILTGKNDTRSTALADIEQDDVMSYGARSFSLNIFKLALFAWSFIISFLKAYMIIKGKKYSAVIGMGGYVSAPALLAAIIRNIPVYLCEQNTIPGKVTVLFAKRASGIFTTFNESSGHLGKDLNTEILALGNPIRKSVLSRASRDEAKTFFNLKHCKKIILVIGGSQGALQINELFLRIKRLYSDQLKDVGVIWSTGSLSYKKFASEIQTADTGGSIYLSPFIDRVGLAYRASDIAISRSGAGVIMELAGAGLPSILIPYPFAADNHQESNADVFEKAGASVKISGKDATPENVGKKLIDLLGNAGMLAKMSRNAETIAKINAAKDIADRVIEDLSRRAGDND